MAALEELTARASVSGLVSSEAATVLSVEWHGADAVEEVQGEVPP